MYTGGYARDTPMYTGGYARDTPMYTRGLREVYPLYTRGLREVYPIVHPWVWEVHPCIYPTLGMRRYTTWVYSLPYTPRVHHQPPGVTVSAPAGLLVLPCRGDGSLGSGPRLITVMRRRELSLIPKV